MSTDLAGPDRQCITDDIKHNDRAKKEPENTFAQLFNASAWFRSMCNSLDGHSISSFARLIDESVWFHTLYGALDGLSVSYSTVKFLCDVFSKTTKEYKEHLNFVLQDWDFWLPLISMGTVFISVASLIGVRSTKKEKQPGSNLAEPEVFLKKYWPYMRDILKGSKNGYKGIKSLALFLTSAGFLDKANFRDFVLPIGLLFGSVAIINRIYLRQISDESKSINKEHTRIQKALKKYNEIQKDIQIKYVELEECKTKRAKKPIEGHGEYIVNLRRITEEIEELEKKKAALDIKSIKSDKVKLMARQNYFDEYYKHRSLIAKAIGGVLDGPYLYVGMASLATLSSPVMMAMSGLIAFFLVSCVVVRVYEEIQEQRKRKLNQLKTEIEAALQDFQDAQLTLIKHVMVGYDGYIKDHSHLGHQLPEKFKELSASMHRGEYLKLLDKLMLVEKKVEEFKKLATPTQINAVLDGLTDGMAAFGALTSMYFALGIVFTLTGVSFPPALVIGGAIFGLFAIASCITYRLYEQHNRIQNIDEYLAKLKGVTDGDAPSTDNVALLNPIDCNTNGLTKGEFLFQPVFEVVRNIFNGPYKSQNLTDFVTSVMGDEVDRSSMVVFGCWLGLAMVYGLCLTLRAFGSGFKNLPQKPKEPETNQFNSRHAFFKPSQPDTTSLSQLPFMTNSRVTL